MLQELPNRTHYSTIQTSPEANRKQNRINQASKPLKININMRNKK